MTRRSHPAVIAVMALAVSATMLGALVRDARSAKASEAASPTPAAIQTRVTELAGLADFLKDRQDIWDTSKRYTRGADRHDKELVRSAFWPEAIISHGEPLTRDEYVDWEEKRLSGFAAHQHHITGQTVELEGDTAHVESYLIYFLVPRDTNKDVPGPASPGKPLVDEKTYLGSGRYVERWEQRDGEWKIAVREYVEDLALKGETVDYCGQRTCLGTWDRNDPSYLRPLEHLTPEQRRLRGEARRQHLSPATDSASRKTSGGAT